REPGRLRVRLPLRRLGLAEHLAKLLAEARIARRALVDPALALLRRQLHHRAQQRGEPPRTRSRRVVAPFVAHPCARILPAAAVDVAPARQHRASSGLSGMKRPRGLYEAIITKALEQELANLPPELSAETPAIRPAEAADRVALHLGRLVKRALDDVH